MNTRESIPLSGLTTFKIGGAARYVIECDTPAAIADAVAFAKAQQLPWYPLGQGSNMLIADEGYEGVIIIPTFKDITITGEEVIAEAGASWDALVRAAAEHGLWGIENLAGIPGTVGAAPVQNIGAYGNEVKDTIAWVEVYDPETNAVTQMPNSECAFGYRDSRFKRNPGLVILRVAFKLSAHGTPNVAYKDLAKRVAEGEKLDTPEAIGNAVRTIRAAKFPDLNEWGTAGSFFKNPVISEEAFAALKAKYPAIPSFPGEQGVKVPLAWILDNVLSLRDFRMGNAHLFSAQPLVIVADRGASADDVMKLATEVATRVHDATGITPEWEVRKFP